MPGNYARFLVGRDRTVEANRQLGFVLAFVAGAINAGGFLAVHQYTSHVTGMVSALADNLALGHLGLVVDGVVGVLHHGLAECRRYQTVQLSDQNHSHDGHRHRSWY